MSINSINPATEEVNASFNPLTDSEIDLKLSNSVQAYQIWKNTPIQERIKFGQNLVKVLQDRKDYLAKIITQEMGRPLAESIAEIEKSAQMVNFFNQNIAKFLEPEIIEIGDNINEIHFFPEGTLLAVMPWNFPFAQVIRASIPHILAGNCVVLKHASNVPICSQMIEEIYEDAGFLKGVFQSLLIKSNQVEQVISDDRIFAVTLTGSENAGSKVAEVAGRNIKKTVLELGGSDPMLVFADCDLEKAAKEATKSRLKNCGQTCNVVKRFIVQEEIVSKFTKLLEAEFSKMVLGDPMDPNTTIGPMATSGILEEVESQVNRSVKMGATIITGGKRVDRKGFYYEPTILGDVNPQMPVFNEEVFGPVAPIISFKTPEEAIKLANDHRYGLTSFVWTQDLELAQRLFNEIEAGTVRLNNSLSSSSELPYGGIKKSGYGRELSRYGVLEFMNIKVFRKIKS